MRDILNQIKKEMEYSNLEMLEMADYFDGLDDADFDNMDDAEYAEYLDYLDDLEDAEKKHRIGRRAGHRHAGHRKAGHRKAGHGHGKRRSSHHGSHKIAALAAIGGGGSFAKKGVAKDGPTTFGSKAYINDLMTRSKGDLNITVTRESINIVGVKLPYILFNYNGLSSNFASTMQNYLPSGVTMTAASEAGTGDMILTYTAPGPLVDTVRISLTGSQISYSEFLQSMTSNYFATRYIRQEYQNDSNLLLGVSQTINFGKLSALGAKGANNLLPRSRRLNDDYQTFIVNLFLPEQTVTTDFSFVQKILAVADYTIAWDVFMSKRINLNSMANG